MGYSAFKTTEEYLHRLSILSSETHLPKEPELFEPMTHSNELLSAAIRFLHDRCEGLRFSKSIETQEQESVNQGDPCFLGKSGKNNKIPYNLEKDIDRLCLEKALETFLKTGTAEDAYIVYYCYIVMFLGDFSKSKRIVEFLSEFETNGSKLLVKHRDHFSHSVFVFALGLAIYETNDYYRNAFERFYKRQIASSSGSAPHFFLRYWGLTSLFHDIGYPFELPFEQVLSYYEAYDVHKKDYHRRGRESLYFSYQAIDTLISLNDREQAYLLSLYGATYYTIDQLFADEIDAKLGDAYKIVKDQLFWDIHDRPTHPDKYHYYMDHAYFSAVRLFRELSKIKLSKINKTHIDCLTAILLHNSLFKYSIAYYKDKKHKKAPLCAELHPLAYLLMLCDELQCWNRTSYGRNTRTELYPFDADFDFSNGGIEVTYAFDQDDDELIKPYIDRYSDYKAGTIPDRPPAVKTFSDMYGDDPVFQKDIEMIVDCSHIPLRVAARTKERDNRQNRTYLSDCSFLHFFDFAVLVHKRKYTGMSPKQLEKELESYSLEYQISHLNRAKNYARSLNCIHCFYTDRNVSFSTVSEFEKDQLETLASLEHVRWVRDHQIMGWVPGELYKELAKKGFLPGNITVNDLRELMRQHFLTMDETVTDEDIINHFFHDPRMTPEEREKDIGAMEVIPKALRSYDGVRIYKLTF